MYSMVVMRKTQLMQQWKPSNSDTTIRHNKLSIAQANPSHFENAKLLTFGSLRPATSTQIPMAMLQQKYKETVERSRKNGLQFRLPMQLFRYLQWWSMFSTHRLQVQQWQLLNFTAFLHGLHYFTSQGFFISELLLLCFLSLPQSPRALLLSNSISLTFHFSTSAGESMSGSTGSPQVRMKQSTIVRQRVARKMAQIKYRRGQLMQKMGRIMKTQCRAS